MTTTRKSAVKMRAPTTVHALPAQELARQPTLVELAKLLKWIAVFLATILGAVLTWWTFADHVDNHWLTTEKANQRFLDQDRNSAWLLSGISELKASASRQWLRTCKRQQGADCTDEEMQATANANEAADFKKQAMAYGKSGGAKEK